MRHQTVHVNGIGMRFAVAGDGRPPGVWREPFTALSEANYRVIAPGLRGSGGSDAAASVESYRIDILHADGLG